MDIIPLTPTHLPAAAALFTAALRRQRVLTPALSPQLEDDTLVIQKLTWLLDAGPAFGALEAGELVGYLGTILVPHFRNTARKGAYIPEWGHAVTPGRTAAVYPALYRASAAQWAEENCQVHAISILAHDRAAIDQWFWHGFGLTVVDAVRPVQPLAATLPPSLTIRKAAPADAPVLAALDAEHCRHYTASPNFMAPPHQSTAAEFAAFLARPHNAAWLRPPYRGRRITPAMLDAALRDYGSRGFTCCAVNFESFNPEAALFWPRYFDAVCLSLTRIPETA